MTESMDEPLQLRVLNLNCWGLYEPFSKFRIQRIVAIADYLEKADYDIVLLEEIWVKKDYEVLCKKLLPTMPHTHYFHCGMMGSGLCIFSKHSILSTFEHTYSLKGFAHKVFHGDWFAGKSVGLAMVNVNGFIINVYVTHTHADYGDPPRYKHLRVVQAFELSEFIKLTSESCDAVIVGGDFNFHTTSVGFKVVAANANLEDSWLSQDGSNLSEEESWTCNLPGSPFAHGGRGSRIDYLLYRANKGVQMVCNLCETAMKQVPGEEYFYSDHAAVEAWYTITKKPTASGLKEDALKNVQLLKETLPVIEEGRDIASKDQHTYGATFVGVLLILITLFVIPDFGLSWLFTLPKLFAVLLMTFSGWMAIIACSKDINAYTAALKDINNLIRNKSSS